MNHTASYKWMWILLFLSIAFNLGVIIYLIGFNAHEEIPNFPQEINQVYKNVPTQNKKELINLLKQRQQEIIYNQRQILLTRLEIARIIQQEGYDKNRLLELFDNLSNLSSKNITLGQNTLYQTILVLPLSERIKIAKVLTQVKSKKSAPIIGAKPT